VPAFLLSRLAAVVALGPSRWRADCPLCGEELRILRMDSGALALACQGGCPARRVVAALGLQLADLGAAA